MKTVSAFAHLKSIVILPFTVTVIVPYILPSLSFNPLIHLEEAIAISIGIFFLLPGLTLFIQSVILFIKIGQGTLAPWDPTKKLVVRNLYRHMRNPMILGVFFILLAESFLFRSMSILLWAFTFLLINHIYFIWREEPDLAKRFGDEYREYKSNVPRWFPRMRGWRPDED